LRVGAIGRVVDQHHQNRAIAPAFKPVVLRTIHLHHGSKTGPPLAPGSMLTARTPRLPESILYQPAPQCFMVQRQPFFG
jgi:hypothetical protein